MNLSRIQGILRRWWQRRTWGWDESEIWSLDVTFCRWIVPRLKLMRDQKFGYPSELPNMEAWTAILTEMIDGFQLIVDDDSWPIVLKEDGSYDKEATEAQYDKINRAFQLFATWAGGLWT